MSQMMWATIMRIPWHAYARARDRRREGALVAPDGPVWVSIESQFQAPLLGSVESQVNSLVARNSSGVFGHCLFRPDLTFGESPNSLCNLIDR